MLTRSFFYTCILGFIFVAAPFATAKEGDPPQEAKLKPPSDVPSVPLATPKTDPPPPPSRPGAAPEVTKIAPPREASSAEPVLKPADPPQLSGLNLLFTRRPWLNFRRDGTVEMGPEAWSDIPYSLERKKLYYNGPTALSSHDYVEMTYNAAGKVTRAVMAGNRAELGFAEFNVANIRNDNITSTTRCTSEMRRDPGKMHCWTVNKPICEAIMRGAKVKHPDELFAKVRECMDLKTALRKLEPELLAEARAQFDRDVKAMGEAKEIGSRAREKLKFEFEDPTRIDLMNFSTKYLALVSSCMAVIGLPTEHSTFGDLFEASGRKDPVPGKGGVLERMPRAVPGP